MVGAFLIVYTTNTQISTLKDITFVLNLIIVGKEN